MNIMKKIVFTSIVCVCLSFSLTACEKETPIMEKELPSEIKSYVERHFSMDKISFSVKDQDGVKLTYDITLQSGVKLEFNSAKEIIDIDGNNKKLPDSVIPEKILSYVGSAFSNAFVTDWKLEGRFQKVELNNSMDLLFDADGNLKKIDD